MTTEKILNNTHKYNFPNDEELVKFYNTNFGFGGDDGVYGLDYLTKNKIEIYCFEYKAKISKEYYFNFLLKYFKDKSQHNLAKQLTL